MYDVRGAHVVLDSYLRGVLVCIFCGSMRAKEKTGLRAYILRYMTRVIYRICRNCPWRRRQYGSCCQGKNGYSRPRFEDAHVFFQSVFNAGNRL